jgi:hypothetical protein
MCLTQGSLVYPTIQVKTTKSLQQQAPSGDFQLFLYDTTDLHPAPALIYSAGSSF